MSLINKHVDKQLRDRFSHAAREAQYGKKSGWNSCSNRPALYIPDETTRERMANELQLSFIDVDDWIEKHLRDKKRFSQVAKPAVIVIAVVDNGDGKYDGHRFVVVCCRIR